MSSFKNPRFAKELAYRTKHNYYSLFSLHPNIDEKRVLLEENKQKMEAEGFATDDYFEVSQLINSLVGLLILPQQEYFAESKEDECFDSMPKFSRYVDSDERFYRNTYICFCKENKKRVPELKNPSNILRHLRNAVAHNRIMIEPESSNGLHITHLRFRDACYYINNLPKKCEFSEMKSGRRFNLDLEIDKRKKIAGNTVCEFDLRIDINDLEEVLMEIADYLIAHDV